MPSSLDSYTWLGFSKPILFRNHLLKHGLRNPKLITTCDYFHVDWQLFSCAFYMIFFLPESTTKKHLHHRFLLVLLKEEVCILHPSSKFSTSVSLELHRAIFFFKGNFYLHVYIHTSDSCTFLHVQRSNEGKHIYYICTYNPISPVTNRRVWLTTSVKIIQYIHKRPLSDLLFGC